MKKTAYLILILLSFVNVLFINAQDASNALMDLQEFEKNKQEYIIKVADLTNEEAKKFFPLNNELHKKKLEIHRKIQEGIKYIEQADNISDEEYENLLQENINLKMKEVELDKEYSDKFNKLMPPQKLFKAHQAERAFMQEELRKYREAIKDGRKTTGKRHK